MPRLPFPLRVLVALTLLAATSPLHAGLIVYDGFGGTPGTDLLGNAGGTGFSGSWMAGGFNASIVTNYDLAAGSLSFGTLSTSGNRVESASTGAIAGVTRDLTVPLGVDGTTRYFSFLLQPQGVLGDGAFNGFFGLTLEQPGEPEPFTGKPGGNLIGQYVIEDRGGSGQFGSGVNAVVGQTTFFVVKAEFNAGIDTFTLYVNPTPGGTEPLLGIVKSDSDVGTVQGLTIYSTGAFAIDEIRVGETFADVTPAATPVPEPSTLGFLALGLAAWAFGSRRKRGLARA